MLKSMFYYAKFDHVNKHLWIVDNDAGGMTVTNDAENVVSYLNRTYPGFRIFYLDTVNNWDELVHEDGVFKTFKSLSEFDLARCPKV